MSDKQPDAPFLLMKVYADNQFVTSEAFTGYKGFMRALGDAKLRGDLVGKPHVIAVERNGKPFINVSLAP